MASIVNSTRIEMLGRNNYDTWSIQVEALLIKSDLWDYVSGKKPKPEIRQDARRAEQQLILDEWIAQDRKAKSDLILSISPSELKQIRGCETSYDIWIKLEGIYASKGPARKASLLKQLILQKLNDNGDVREHLSRFFDIVDKLSAMNIEINGDLLTIMLLYSLPDSFDNFRCAIETRDTLPDAESLKVKIIEENDARIRRSNHDESNAMYAKNNLKKKSSNNSKAETNNVKTNKKKIVYKCNYYQKKGHKKSECFAKKRDKGNKSSKDQNANHVDESFFINSPEAENEQDWCIDSGCTSHLCKNRDSFSNYENTDSRIQLANTANASFVAKVSTKALAGAKSLGGFLYSAVNKAGKTVVEASVKIKKTVEENRLIAELNKEQEAFIASKQMGEKGEAVAPWVGAPNEDALREECLSLSTDRRNFVRAPPPGVEFAWDFEAVQPMAQATLALDPNLEAMRFELVPKVISEENFWRNYFYRVSLLRQGYELNAMASSQQQSESNSNQTLASTTDSIDHTQVQMTTGQTTTPGATTTSSNSALADSPGHEFVSDTMRVSDTDLEEVREGMRKLGMQPPKEEDWERELEAELKDYEVVTGGHEKISSSSNVIATRDVTVNDNDWEKHIDELLANEDDEDLK